MKTSSILKVACLALPLVLGSCKSKQPIADQNELPEQTMNEQNFLGKIAKNAVETSKTQFMTSKVKFSVEYGAQSITLTGNLRMKRDDVIRLQLMAFGFVEAARIEFTKEYVLILDRINKQYIMAPYGHVDFLRNSGLNFYSIQALFWNELFQPNHTTLDESDYERFATNMGDNSTDDVVISLDDGKMYYSWLADNKKGIIKMANILYKDRFNGNSQLNWDYEDFKLAEGGKQQFPHDMAIMLTTSGKEVKLNMKLNYINHESEWETRTQISNKYREVNIDEMLRRFLQL
jgi:hypothetical protein